MGNLAQIQDAVIYATGLASRRWIQSRRRPGRTSELRDLKITQLNILQKNYVFQEIDTTPN